ncbi:hypothetical protein VB714_14270 [Spirulina sp. 06S082]|nr:hypothetical protein [Spirulina sp. 06S082]MEA5470041.1 hypothetical protein [Spirulina sp. 06S082]
MVVYADIEVAADRLAGVAHRTPVMTSRQFNEKTQSQVFFKCENFFKFLNRSLSSLLDR